MNIEAYVNIGLVGFQGKRVWVEENRWLHNFPVNDPISTQPQNGKIRENPFIFHHCSIIHR
jgi:hypothetical protein